MVFNQVALMIVQRLRWFIYCNLINTGWMSSSFQLATQSTTGIGNSQDQVITSARPKAPVERNQPYIASSSTSSPATLGSIVNSMRKPTLTLEEAN